jgi:predicted MFS family arabinose efflux permease
VASQALRRAVALSFGPAVALGFARFAYALVLPAMRSDLGWSYAFAGAMNTANALGYLLGALASERLMRSLGPRASFVGSLAATVATLGLTAATGDGNALLVIRFVNGVAAAMVFIAGATLAAHVASDAAASRAVDAAAGRRVVGTYFGGVGVGIVVSGATLPFLVEAASPHTWPRAWLLMAAIGMVATLVAWAAARGVPLPAPVRGARREPARLGKLRAALVAYLLFGFGYIGYMTFLVAFVQGAGWGRTSVAAAWIVLGLAAASTALVWEPVLERLAVGRALALILTTLTVGSALPLATTQPLFVLISTLLVGVSFLAVVSALTELVRTTLPPPSWGAAIAFATVVFATGQALGPLVTGLVADRLGGLSPTLAVSAASLALAVPVALLQGQASHAREARAR